MLFLYLFYDFKVFMFEEDIERMEKYVCVYFYLEIGGDLFGLWIFNGDVVIYVVFGLG